MAGAYDENTANWQFYPGGSIDPVRANVPYTPVEVVPANRTQVPLVGVLVVAGVILFLEWMRRGR